MNDSSNDSLQALFEAALAKAPELRAGWLAEACPDPRRLALLSAMLEADVLTAQILGTPAHEVADLLSRSTEAFDIDRLVGGLVGPFRVERLIGQGGMASVFLAQREGTDFQQTVALKVLQRGLYSAVEQRLFRRERRALAALEHPNIARLIDGGVTESGVPFLAMEFVDGVAITQYCAQRQLDLQARLMLFLTVCRAVDAAHRALIVHRDIKPSNILVTAAGGVKLLDFGIAKLLDQEGDETTHAGLSAMTPQYAAPEQIAGDTITTATDVYALGILLHELLLGERPDREQPRRPSSRVVELDSDLWVLPAPRSTLRNSLRGDLDNILLKALENEPQRRYPSAGAFADDIANHLAGRPVHAHPPSAWYRTQKFMQRHRGGVVLTAMLVLAVFASLALALWQGAEARRQAQRAQQQSKIATAESARANQALKVSESVQNFLLELFDSAIPAGPKDQQPTLQELVIGAEQRVREDIDSAPEVRFELYRRLLSMHGALGNHDAAARIGTEALQFSEAAFGIDSEQARVARFDAAVPRFRRGDPAALGVMEATVAAAAQRGAVSVDIGNQMLTLGAMLSELGRGEEGMAMISTAARQMDQTCASGNIDACDMRALALNNLGTAQFQQAQMAAARTSFAEAVRLHTAHLGPEHRQTGRSLGNLALTEAYLGERSLALQHIQQALRIDERSGTARAPTRAAQRTTLAMVLSLGGRRLDNVAALAETIATATPEMAKDRGFPVLRLNYAKALLEVGDYAEAAKQIAHIRPSWEAAAAENRNNLARMFETLAVLAADADHDPALAKVAIDAAIAQRRQQQPAPPSDLVATLTIAHRLAVQAGDQRRATEIYAEAEALITTNLDMPESTRLNWQVRRIESALHRGDTSAAAVYISESVAVLGVERPDSRFDRLQILRLKLSKQTHIAPEPDTAEWFADLERRSGPNAPTVIEARALLLAR